MKKKTAKTKTERKIKKKKSEIGMQAQETGKQLEKRVTTWLKKQGYTCKERVLARGKIVARPYEVDIYATKGFIDKHHLWVECKAYTVKRSHVTKLVESARDVKELGDESNVQKWSPNMLMLVSNKGFDTDAIKIADNYKIYCVVAGRTFKFVGKKKKNNMDNRDESKL